MLCTKNVGKTHPEAILISVTLGTIILFFLILTFADRAGFQSTIEKAELFN